MMVHKGRASQFSLPYNYTKRPAYSSLRNKRLEDTVGNEMRPWRDALSAYLNNLPEMEG